LRLATYRHQNQDHFGLVVEDILIDLSASSLWPAKPPDSMRAFLEMGREGMEIAERIRTSYRQNVEHGEFQTVPVSVVQLLAPVPSPSKMPFVGRNYRDHVSEAGAAASTLPNVFAKFSSNVIGTGGEIVLPPGEHEVDFEAEVAVVVGSLARQVPVSSAMDHVAGLTIANDVSARDIQFGENQLTLGKNYRSFAPIGPWLVTMDEFEQPLELRIQLWLNGELMQDANTSEMIWSIPALVSFLSSVTDLEPGDIIATGTPGGSGYFRTPRISLKHGDVIRIQIEGIGELVNRVVEHSTTTS